MDKEATDVENARKILEIYHHFDAKEGHVLRANNFMAVGSSKHWDMGDLQAGLDYAVENRWLEKTPTGWLALTARGYSEM